MLKVTIDSFKGKKLITPMIVFVETRTNVDSVGNRLICGFSQSETQDQKEKFDWLDVKKSVVIQENPSLPAKATDLPTMAELLVKNWINSLNLPQIKSIENI